MKTDYKPIKPMKEIPDQLRKLRRQFLRYQQAEIRRLQHTGAEARCRLIAENRQILADLRAVIV